MKPVLDPCSGSRMFYFDKNNENVMFGDIREGDYEVVDRTVHVHPDYIGDVTKLPFPDESFYHVCFDPPHLTSIGDTAWMSVKYGKLQKDSWKTFIHDGFEECYRVLKPGGTLIFKWNEYDIPVREVISAIGRDPLYGSKAPKKIQTHWLVYVKELQ